ncbi:MAG TPA: hypothetical protein DCF73_12285 [Rhodobiaceae bacterium]|nr:hypothetical protein [Rhodobiaceae bacterium]
MLESVSDYAAFFRCSGEYDRKPVRIVVLAQKVSPTRDLYLRRRLAMARLPVHYWTLGENCPVSLNDAFVIVVRYVDRTSLAQIEEERRNLSGLAWLLDDDVAAALGDSDLPLHYRAFMAHFWLRFARRLAGVTSEIWAASDVLADRLAQSGLVSRIDPLPEAFALPAERDEPDLGQPLRVFYHGQKTHRPEREWLHPVVKTIHDRYPSVHFEMIGDAAVKAKYRELDRVLVTPAFTWPDYLARSRATRFDIGLAPLLSTPFNRARSWGKYLDIARFGAVGIYAEGQPYDRVVRDGENGLLRSAQDPDAWIDALALLIEDHAFRKRLTAGVNWPAEIALPDTLGDLLREDSRG